ncbi:SusC/RagA family TonB-linked outer membrane protein [Arenibacter echinorum]|uniref:TonB-linked SusC/RagA family outer membrane protein n=1 Tax=Arenibacter echinorum TaxID=440515 RepID=A0A327R2F7_9FLAO|nr:SusC/RagA family TonB-linked outer membrane protein [Arenibacter echinorum]RAJ10238.1 TonB-linked SusC/RagA family outer membrane protein [Arenibacter echinorum]
MKQVTTKLPRTIASPPEIGLKQLFSCLFLLMAFFHMQAISGSGEINVNSTEVLAPQDLEITGTVSDANGAPLPGASILVKGTNNGTTSDFDGNYSITVSGNASVLVFSYIGFTSKEVTVKGQSSINVSLEESNQALDEVVVTALGIERDRKTLGYATSKVDSEEFSVNRTPNFMDALQGKVAGVNISALGSGPQGSSKIRIRGISSFGNNNSPLIVVNGVPINNTSFGVESGAGEVGSNRNSDSGDGLSSINPDDVESMTILKGAAASALYGSRAKDGVIMITTKNRSEEGGVEVTFNTNYTNGTPLDFTDYQYEYGQGEGGVRPNAPFPNSGVWSFGEPVGGTQILFDGLVVPYEPQRNKIREYYRNSSTLMNTISVASGGENGGINFSAANMDATSILPGSKYSRRTINLGFTQKLKKFTISGNINYSNEERINPPNIAEQDFSPVVIYTLASTMPMDLLKENCCDNNGDEISYSRFTNRTNPYFALKRFENNRRDRVFGNITTTYNFTDWLSAQARIGQDYYMRDVDYNLPTGSQRQAAAPPGFVNGEYIQDQRRFREVNADFLISANKNFGEFGTMLNFGGNQMYQRSDINTILGRNFYTRDLYTIGNASTVSPNYSRSERQVNSLYAAAELSYGGYLYLNGTMRNDWFSTLSPANRSILYPSVTGSFVFSQAMKNRPQWLSFGKIRVAYAQVGSDTDVAPYSDNLFYTVNPLQLLNQPVGGINTSTIPNPNLKPMQVTEREVGLELTLFNNLRFEASYYNKLSSDQILQAQTSDASGYSTRLINVGKSRNEGVEVFISATPIQTDNFSWNTSSNLSYNTSEVLSLGENVDDSFITVGNSQFHGELRQVVGKPMAQLYGWGYLRDDQGNQIFDANNGLPLRSKEQIEFGTALPVWVGGFTNSFKYKNLTLSFLVDYKLGHKMISGTHVNAYRHGLDKATLVGRDVGYVIGEGVNLDGSVNTTRAAIQPYYETIRSHRGSEESLFNAGSWQLRQVSLGYDFTKHLKKINFVKGLKFDIVANNVAVLKKWVPHIHPDQNGIIGDQFVGLEATGLPITRDIGFNMNIKF